MSAKKPELLAPAGDLERLKVAVAYGADAVYLGGHAFGMRAGAKNFSEEEMAQGIAHAHAHGVKVYVTCNIFAHNDDFTAMASYFLALEKMGADALIISDLGVFSLAQTVVPDMELHISTQANCTNFAAAAFWQGMGAARVILARELSLREIREINRKVPALHLEAFVHGAMCMAYSGRCLISNYLTGAPPARLRDANRGDCIQPCRWSYTLLEEKSGELLRVQEDTNGTYIFNARDMCMIRYLPDLVYAGVRSMKIEGRMKTAYYVAVTTQTYRRAIDDHHADPELYEANLNSYTAELNRLASPAEQEQTPYSTGFYFAKPDARAHSYTGDNRFSGQDFLAIVESYDPDTQLAAAEQRNKFSIGDKVEILHPRKNKTTQTVTALYDENGAEITSAPHPKQKIFIKLDAPAERFSIIRRL